MAEIQFVGRGIEREMKMMAVAEVYGDGVILCKDEEDRQKKKTIQR